MGEAWATWADWLSYRPSDFLMFSPRVYWRLFELHNVAWWPAQWLALAMGALGAVAAVRAGGVLAQRAVPGVLALAWAFVAWYFHVVRYAPINWAATGLAWLFVAQALVLLGLASQPRTPTRLRLVSPERRHGPLPTTGTTAPRHWAALALWLLALVLYPCLAPLQGRPWAQAEAFGLAPDPTVVATLAWLLATPAAPAAVATKWQRGLRAAAWALALTGSAVSAATLATMGEWQALGLVLAILLAGFALAPLTAARR